MNKKRLKIAVQSKGRLNAASLDFLKSTGLEFDINNRNLMIPCSNINIDILFLRDDDIPEYVTRGVADFGIVGKNVLLEKEVRTQIRRKLNFGVCKLAIAIPQSSDIKQIADLEGERIATSYPKLLTQFLKQNSVNAAVIPLSGSVEVAPQLGLADAICDLVQTGNTLEENKLKLFETVLESQAVLIESPMVNPLKSKLLQL